MTNTTNLSQSQKCDFDTVNRIIRRNAELEGYTAYLVLQDPDTQEYKEYYTHIEIEGFILHQTLHRDTTLLIVARYVFHNAKWLREDILA